MGLPNESEITIWDLINYSLFDRDIAMFDVLTFIIIFIDGISFKKPVALCLVMHWVLRSIGGIVGAIVQYNYQSDPYQWRYFQSYPSVFWYAGELLLDSYPFQKAWAVATGNPKFRILALVGFVPLVVVKSACGIFRYIDPLFVDQYNMDAYYAKFNPLDATVFLLSAWSDICCCIVIVAVSARWFQKWLMRIRKKSSEAMPRDEFLDSLVVTTEIRMIVCTVLAVTCSTLIFLASACVPCEFGSTARFINIDYVYCLYYLDYLILKYRKTELINSSHSNPIKDAMFSPPVGSLIHVGPVIGMQSSAVSLDANMRRGGMTTDESVVYGRYESDQTSGSAYYMDDLDHNGKRWGR